MIQRSLLALLLVFASPGATFGQCEFDLLESTAPVINSEFGRAVAISGNWLAVGTLVESQIYIYERCGRNWFLRQQIADPVPAVSSNLFGARMEMDGLCLVVGAQNNDELACSAGTAYVYQYDGSKWVLTQQLFASDGQAGDVFGGMVALQGTRMVIGAVGVDVALGGEGAVYVFELIGGQWVESAKITASDGAFWDGFGSQFGLRDSRLAVYSASTPTGQTFIGAVYVFEESGEVWSETAKIQPAGAGAFEFFGTQIVLNQDQIIVGSLGDEDNGPLSGSVYVFEQQGGTWVEVQKLLAEDGAVGDQFGTVLELDNSTLAVAATKATGSQGTVYLYSDTSGAWLPVGRIAASNPMSTADYGSSLTLDGDILAVGSPEYDVGTAFSAGQVYTVSVGETLCPSFNQSADSVSLSTGGLVELVFSPGPRSAGSFFFGVGTISGTDPGFPLGGATVPINIDDYFALSLVANPASPLLNNMGLIESNGIANSDFLIMPGTDPTLVGLTLEHAFIAFTLSPFVVEHVSNTNAIELLP